MWLLHPQAKPEPLNSDLCKVKLLVLWSHFTSQTLTLMPDRPVTEDGLSSVSSGSSLSGLCPAKSMAAS